MKFNQLIKVLLYNDTTQYKLVWKSLTVFCEVLLAHLLAFSNIVFSRHGHSPTFDHLCVLYHCSEKLWARSEGRMYVSLLFNILIMI